ncbi:MAG: hypothetical protein R2867_18925 [Caldilineaceae bacterium]
MIPTYTEDRIRSQQNRTDSPDRYPDSDLERYPDWGSQESRGYYQESRPHHQAARRVDPYASRTGTAPMAGYGRDHATGPEPKDLVLGLLGGVAGVIAMDIFSQQIMPLLTQDQDQGNSGQSQDGGQEQEHALDSIAVISEHHRKSESATAALGRILYHWATDEDPDKQTKTTLSYLVHWGYGIAQGGVYAAACGPAEGADLAGGLAFGTGLWLLGDEMIVPMLGLQSGPTASGPGTHLNRLAMHLVYGVTTAATVQWLRRLT